MVCFDLLLVNPSILPLTTRVHTEAVLELARSLRRIRSCDGRISGHVGPLSP
jgi:hypothetical protein